MRILWVDDIRDPFSNMYGSFILKALGISSYPNDTQITWVKNFAGFCNTIENEDMYDVIFFDHDLGEEESGKDCANFLIDYCIDNNIDVPQCYSQSSNPVGRKNILSYIESYEKIKRENNI